MALQKSFETSHGFTCENAYHRIMRARIRKTEEGDFSLRIRVAVYFDAAARAAGKPAVGSSGIGTTYDIGSVDNAYVQGYAFLKTLDEYSGTRIRRLVN